MNLNTTVGEVSEEKSLHLLYLLYGKLERKPTFREIDMLQETPSSNYYRRHFGCVENALNKIGIITEKGHRYSKDEIILEIKRVTEKLGKVPTKQEFNKESSMCSGIIVKRYGWNNLLKELNLSVNMEKYTNEQLLEYLKKFKLENNRIPIMDDFKNNENYPNFNAYFKHFGSWNNALKLCGFDVNECVYIAEDGHKCLSTIELYIDNYLFHKGIEHEKEPVYPYHKDLNPNNKKRADWKIGNTYVEYFGLMRRTDYKERTEYKLRLCKELNISLIPIYPQDMSKLNEKFESLC